jgi:hypothetical protein
LEKDGSIVRELSRVDSAAVVIDTCSVVYGIIRADDTNTGDPVPGLHGVLSIRSIVRIPGQTGSHVEEDTISDGILVVVTGIREWNLPPQTTSTGAIVTVGGRLSIEDGLRECQPLRILGRRVLKVHLGG